MKGILVRFLIFNAIIAAVNMQAKAQSVPQINSMYYDPHAQGTANCAIGTGFGASQGAGEVLLNGAQVGADFWTDSEVCFTIPSNQTLGANTVQVINGVGASNTVSFTVEAPPAITSISPGAGPAGSQVTITGTGFGTLSEGSVRYWTSNLDSVGSLPIVSWSDTQIVVTIPSNLTPMSIVIQLIADGLLTQGTTPNFSVVGPGVITGMFYDPRAQGAYNCASGTGFGANQGSGTVLLNGAQVAATFWSDAEVCFTIPSNQALGSNTVQVTNGVGPSNTVSFTVEGPPTISNISPAAALAGSQVTITGTGFGTLSEGRAQYWIGGPQNYNGLIALSIVSWSDTQVVVTIPSNLTPSSGIIELFADGLATSTASQNFSVIGPGVITGMFENPIAQGAGDCAFGTGFGATQGSGTLLLNGAQVTATYWSNGEVCFNIPANQALGSNTVQITNGVAPSNTVSFTVEGPPTITNINPAAALAGSQVTITGTGFGTISEGSARYWVGVPPNISNVFSLAVVSWSDTQVVLTIPSNAPTSTGVIQLFADGLATDASAQNFAIGTIPPAITAIVPTSGQIGTQITIAGSSFGASQGSGTVSIGGANALIVSWTNTQIVAVVASGSTTGNLVVQQGGAQSNGVNFTVNSGPLLQLAVSNTPIQVNLTSPQNLDWVHWGRISPTQPDRKAGIAPLISDYTVIGGGQVLSTNGVVNYSWTDGNQQASVSGTNADLQQFGGGFQITVPADTTVKTLNLYALVQCGQAQVQASLSDGSAAAITDQSVGDLDIGSKIYSIDFSAASAGQTLTVTLSAVGGFVGLEAAALTPHLPVITIASPARGESFSAPASVPLNAIAYQYNNSVSDVKFNGSGGSTFDAPNAPYIATWSSLNQGHYSVRATATDAAGLYNSSAPVEFDSIGSGGALALQVAAAPSSVNLTTQGATDWVLWGAAVPASDPASTVFDRKAGVTPSISNYTPIGNHLVYDSNDGNTPPAFTYTDGSQSSSAWTQDMLYVFDQNDGYKITVSADTNQRTLQLYTGVNFGQAKITAYLSDGSAAVVSDDSITSSVPSPLTGNDNNAVYTITYSAASAGQTLTVRYTLEQSYSAPFGSLQLPAGELYLMAAALSGPAPTPLAPNLAGVQPSSGPAGSTFTLTGSGFGAVQNDSALTLNGLPAIINSWSDTQIVATVPAVPPGAYPITLYGVAGPQFTVVPAIASLTPASGPAGSSVTILGSGFGAVQGSGTVTFNGVTATVASWADSGITAAVPAGAASGNVVVTTAQSVSTNGIGFTVLPSPAITALGPASGAPGTQVSIAGSNFGAVQGTGNVQIGNQAMPVLSWSDGLVSALIPAGAMTGNIVLTASSGGLSNPVPFAVNFGGPVLQYSVQDSPLQVNLTSAQTLDWIKWGRISATQPDRKGGVTPLISDYTPVGGILIFPGGGTVAFSWSDGEQGTSVSKTNSDIETPSVANGTGFQITVPADTAVQTLNLYVEVFGSDISTAQGLLQASLSDGSASPISDQSVTDFDFASKVYSIDFRAASPGQTLTVSFTALSGGVGLQAATLTPHLPAVAIASPANGQSVPASTTIPVTMTASQFDESVTAISGSASDGTLFNGQSSPLNASWSPVASGHYVIKASAQDATGLSNAASPVQVDIIGQGGTLSLVENKNIPSSPPINLDDSSIADWVLWGQPGEQMPGNIFDRKSGVAPLISDYRPIGNHPITSLAFANNLCFTGNQQSDCAGLELAVHDAGNGFEIKVPADTTPRTLDFYASSNNADGFLTAFLSDGSAPVATIIGVDSGGGGGSSPPPSYVSQYVVNYSAASPGQTLTVRFTLNSDWGGGTVDLIGAALIGPAGASANASQISSISPATSAVNTQVTLAGNNFGASQGTANVRFGAVRAKVVSWSNTAITVIVPGEIAPGMTVPVAVFTSSGDSNAVNFTVSSYQLYPASLNLLVGQSASVKAKDASGNLITGLTWIAQDPNIVSLSTDDPPLITGLVAGSTTVYAGDVPLPVSVYAGTSLPTGTPIWSLPVGNGTGITSIVPAVPSDSGIDVYALSGNGSLSAVSADGDLIWSQRVGLPTFSIIPDFSGNIFITQPNIFLSFNSSYNLPVVHSAGQVNQLNPSTGQITTLYVFSGQFDSEGPVASSFGSFDDALNYSSGPATNAVPSPAGVLFVQDVPQVLVMNPATGQTVATIPIDSSTYSCETGSHVRDSISGQMIVAGDGNAYVPYVYTSETDQGCGTTQIFDIQVDTHLMLLRVSPDGSFAKIPLQELNFEENANTTGSYLIPYLGRPNLYPPNLLSLYVLTNADQGVAVFSPPPSNCPPCTNLPTQTVMTLVSNDAVAGQFNVQAPGFQPTLQREDGSYIGVDTNNNLEAVGLDGSLPWQTNLNVPPKWDGGNVSPLYALAGGGAMVQVSQPGVPNIIDTLDQNGNITAQAQDTGAIVSWTGNWYMDPPASLSQVALPQIEFAMSLGAFFDGNPSGTDAAGRPWYFKLVWQNDFVFIPDNPSILNNLKTDISDQVTPIKQAALAAFKKAFSAFPVIADEGSPDTGDHRINVVKGEHVEPSTGLPVCGITKQFPPVFDSSVYYELNMEQAQWAINVQIRTPQDLRTALTRPDLFASIGTGIGNNGAHEMAHQFLLNLFGMDDGSTNTYNGQGCNGGISPWIYVGNNIHWEDVTFNALKNKLGTGWHKE